MEGFYWLSMSFLAMDWSAVSSQPVMAYIGPGGGLSAIGVLLAVVVGIVVAVLGFVWYPLKRVMRNLRLGEPGGDPEEESKT